MGALTAKSDMNGLPTLGGGLPTPQAPSLGPLPQGESPMQSALMKGLTNYFNAQTNAAGNPNAASPSMTSSLMQPIGSAIDNSSVGGLANSMAGNSATDGFGAQLAGTGMAASGADAAGATGGADAAAGADAMAGSI